MAEHEDRNGSSLTTEKEEQQKETQKPARRSSTSSTASSSTASTSSITSLFESSLALLGSLPVATSSSNRAIVHETSYHGIIKLHLSKVDTYEELQLQSHLLWPSSPKLAELMESGHARNMQGERVLELGAGSALLSLLAARMKASHVLITDYPNPGIMKAIRDNVACNLTDEEISHVNVSALDWTDGDGVGHICGQYPDGFSRILAADTLWMGHLNACQIRVMSTLLARTADARVQIVAGLHTGRHVIRSFLDEVVRQGLEVEKAVEVDRLDEGGVAGVDWLEIMRRQDYAECEVLEGVEEDRRRWLVWIVLKWPTDGLAEKS